MFGVCNLHGGPYSGYGDQKHQQQQQQQAPSLHRGCHLHRPSLDFPDRHQPMPLMDVPPLLSQPISLMTPSISLSTVSSYSSVCAQNSSGMATATLPQSTRPFGCGIPGCDETYASSYDLYDHMKSLHASVLDHMAKPYRCSMPDCVKRYKNLNGLQYHVTTKGTTGHGVQEVAPTRKPSQPRSSVGDFEKTYLCTVEGCTKRYKTANGLDYHMSHSQGVPGHVKKDISPPLMRDKPFKCNSCDKAYLSAKGLNYHLLHSHGKEGMGTPRTTVKTKGGGSQDLLENFLRAESRVR